MGEVLDPLLGDDYVVLDADAELAADVDPRLDGDDVAGDEDVDGLGREAWILVDVEAEAVAEPVPHCTVEIARVDDRARERVRFDAREAGADSTERRVLCRVYDLVRLAQAG